MAVGGALEGCQLGSRGPYRGQAAGGGQDVHYVGARGLRELGYHPSSGDLGREDDVLGGGIVGRVGGDHVHSVLGVDRDRGGQHVGCPRYRGLDRPQAIQEDCQLHVVVLVVCVGDDRASVREGLHVVAVADIVGCLVDGGSCECGVEWREDVRVAARTLEVGEDLDVGVIGRHVVAIIADVVR